MGHAETPRARPTGPAVVRIPLDPGLPGRRRRVPRGRSGTARPACRAARFTSLAQTAEGYLWIGTHNGLVRFDGARFVSFDPATTSELAHARVENLFVDDAGRLWVNTYDGSLTSWTAGAFRREWAGSGGRVRRLARLGARRAAVFVLETGDLIRREAGPDAAGRWEVLRAEGTALDAVRLRGPIRGALDPIGGPSPLAAGGEAPRSRWPGRPGSKACEVNHLVAGPDGRVWIGTEREVAVWTGRRFEKMDASRRRARDGRVRPATTRDGGLWSWPTAGRERPAAAAGSRARRPAAISPERSGSRSAPSRTATVGPGSRPRQGAVPRSPRRQRPADRHGGRPAGRPGQLLPRDREGNFWVGSTVEASRACAGRRFAILSPAEASRRRAGFHR